MKQVAFLYERGWGVTCACCHSALEVHSGVLGGSAIVKKGIAATKSLKSPPAETAQQVPTGSDIIRSTMLVVLIAR